MASAPPVAAAAEVVDHAALWNGYRYTAADRVAASPEDCRSRRRSLCNCRETRNARMTNRRPGPLVPFANSVDMRSSLAQKLPLI